jgi:hypothetical protein
MNLAHPSSRVPRFRALVSAAGSPPGRIPAFLACWGQRFWKFLDSVEERDLAPLAFTAVLPLESMAHEERTELLDRLRELNGQSSPLLTTPGICRMRLTVRADSDFDVHRTECYPFGALVVDCTHARDREDFLYELFEMHGNVLDAALKHCRDYPGMNVLDACVRLLFSAAEERKVAANDPCRPIPLSGLPQLHEYEHEVADERLWIERVTLLARTASRKKTRAARRIDPEAKAVRGVHPKHHGLLQAKFLVRDDLPLKFRQGVFKPGAKYDAVIRVLGRANQRTAVGRRCSRRLEARSIHDRAGRDDRDRTARLLDAPSYEASGKHRVHTVAHAPHPSPTWQSRSRSPRSLSRESRASRAGEPRTLNVTVIDSGGVNHLA